MDVDSFLEEQKHAIEEEKKRLGIIDQPEEEQHEETFLVSKEPKISNEKENVPVHNFVVTGTPENTKTQNAPLDQALDLSCITKSEDSLSGLQANQQQFLFRTDDSKRAMLRYGDYSPNNPELRVTAAPYLGLGEYEQRRELLLRQRQKDHKEYINSIQYSPTQKTDTAVSGNLSTSGPPTIETTRNVVMHNNRSPVLHRLDQRITAAHNSLLKPEMVDKPRGILTNRRTESPRERLLSDLKHSYVPTLMDGFSFSDRADDMERERIKREIYQNELRLQIEEKRRIVAMREEQERREQELENRRLEQQLLRMQEEQLRDEQRRNRREQMRRNSDDYASRKQEIQQQSRPYRKHTDSESSVSNIRSSTNVASKLSSHYSPPMSRRNVPFSFNVPSASVFAEPSTRYNPSRYDSFLRNRMDSLNVPQDTYYSPKPPQPTSSSSSPFGRYDSLSRIDSLKQQEALNRLETLSISDSLNRVQRRHSATQQDLSMIRRSPKLQRRSSSSRFEDSLPIPVLKAHSPVARELKNSIAVNSTRHGSDAVRRLEDKWQIPAVQKNVINHGDVKGGQSRNVLTQLGAIRMQLQREQLRMDETLERRSIQSKAVH